MNQEYINAIDLALGSMFIMHVLHQMFVARHSLHRLRRICKSNQKVRMGYFRILCNSLFGPEEMSWSKITASTLLFISFFLLTIYGSFFGFVGAIATGFMGSVKTYYSIRSKYIHA